MMSIEIWSENERPDYEAVLAARREAEERTRLRHQQEQEALAWRRQKEAARESESLWSWYREYDPRESFAAQENAREMKRARELREEIRSELMAVEMGEVVRER